MEPARRDRRRRASSVIFVISTFDESTPAATAMPEINLSCAPSSNSSRDKGRPNAIVILTSSGGDVEGVAGDVAVLGGGVVGVIGAAVGAGGSVRDEGSVEVGVDEIVAALEDSGCVIGGWGDGVDDVGACDVVDALPVSGTGVVASRTQFSPTNS